MALFNPASEVILHHFCSIEFEAVIIAYLYLKGRELNPLLDRRRVKEFANMLYFMSFQNLSGCGSDC